jgi:D-alanyl-D-alanine carboxypeptidase (penicillin-binding protein 5/6)
MRYAAVVVDAQTGEVLFSRRADSLRYPASVTKVMTLYLTFEALQTGKLKPDDLITISPRAAAQAPTKLGLAPGDTLTVSDAMQALAIKSANDIAVALDFTTLYTFTRVSFLYRSDL